LRQRDGATGYADVLRHGETGTGLNDYDTIFRLLAETNFNGWISIEDGMNGLEELRRSAVFLKAPRARFFPDATPREVSG
jgi:sugar phosphate isomerase/epimerase